MQVQKKNFIALIAFTLLPIIGVGLYVFVVMIDSPNEDVRLGVIGTQFQQYQATAEVYRSRLLDYAGMCDDIGLPPYVTCVADDTSYRLSQPLTDGTYYCADSTNQSGVTPVSPRGLTCPDR